MLQVPQNFSVKFIPTIGNQSRPHYAQSMYVVALLYILTTVKLITIIVNGVLSVNLNHMVVKNHLHSSSDVQEVVWSIQTYS
jgi:hypothetical protein